MNKFWLKFSILIIFSIILASSTNKVKYKYFGFFHSLKKNQMQLTKINVTENEEVQKICGQSNSTHTRRVFKIMGGMEAETGQFPWTIALLLQLKQPIKKSKLHLQCTGSLISQKHAIISAHCIMNIHADCMQSSLNKVYEYVIAYGGINLKCTENEMRNCEIPEENSSHWMEITRVTKMFIPMKPIQQNCRNPAYDFVILELEDKIKFDENTKPICIVSNLKNKLNSKIVMDNGWGRDETESHSYVLRYKYGKVLAIIPTNYLESDKNNDNKISNTTFEGTIITRGILHDQPNSKLMPTICTGDSGGSLIGQITKENGETRNVLLGIHSQGESSGICHKNSALMKIPRKISAFDWEAHTFGPSIADQICQWTGVCEID